jgi:hypothetical protein
VSLSVRGRRRRGAEEMRYVEVRDNGGGAGEATRFPAARTRRGARVGRIG